MRRGDRLSRRSRKKLPRQQFEIKIQASIGAKVIAAERISALRKDVTAKLYGGDVTRKQKLLKKQKRGEEAHAQHGPRRYSDRGVSGYSKKINRRMFISKKSSEFFGLLSLSL